MQAHQTAIAARSATPSRRFCHAHALLAGVSALALLTASVPARARNILGGGNASAATANAAAAAVASVQQAAAIAQRSMTSLTRATQAIQAMQAAQTAAHNLTLASPSTVPNGLATGGLVPSSGLAATGVANPVGAYDPNSNPTGWVSANTPVQTVSGEQTTVTVVQTAQKALLNWSSFNIGAATQLHIDQSAGTTTTGNNWVALNRVVDPSGVPSQILGSIKAEGSVYLIDANGIIFGGAAQVNVNSLIASSLNLFSNTMAVGINRFLTGGIGDLNQSNNATNSILLTSAGPGAGSITIEPGAAITLGTAGLALIAAPNVSNGGTITAPSGQVALVAGIGVAYDYNAVGGNAVADAETTTVRQGYNDNSTTFLQFASDGTWLNASGADITPVGTLANIGLISATTGNITLLGGTVRQNGVAVATTSVARPGSIVIQSQYEVGRNAAYPDDESALSYYTGSVSFGPQSVTAVMPDSGGATIPSDAASLAPFASQFASTAQALPTRGLGLVAISGQAIDFQGGTLVYAPGQSIAAQVMVLADPRTPVPGSGRILVESGAVLDVSGIAGVTEQASADVLTVALTVNELADDPLQRDGALYGKTITVNMLDSGTNAETGESWVGTPIANLASYEALVPNTIDELLVKGGAITLQGPEIVTETGSVLNLTGGYVSYQGGMIATTRLAGADGHLYDIGSADPTMTYLGIAGVFQVDHAAWGITQAYGAPLVSGAFYQEPYIQGADAGSLTIVIDNNTAYGGAVAGAGAAVLDATMLAQSVSGTRQVAAGTLPSDGSFTFEGILPIEIGDHGVLSAASLAAATLPANFSMASPLLAAPSDSPYATVNVIASTPLNEASFGNIALANEGSVPGLGEQAPGSSRTTWSTVNESLTVDAGTTLTVQPGGTISLSGGNVTINGTLNASSGAIVVTTEAVKSTFSNDNVPGNIMVGATAVLNVSGLFYNEVLDDQQISASPLINGGTIALTTDTSVTSAGTPMDLTGNITLAAGSYLDLQSGGLVLANRTAATASNGTVLGQGGNLTLVTYGGIDTPAFSSGAPTRGQLALDGRINALGFTAGGTLTLQAAALQIGGNPALMPSGGYYFDATQWGDDGFDNFVLTAASNVAIPAGATIRLTHQNLLANLQTIVNAPNGADPAAYATVGSLTGTQLSPTGLTVTAGLEQAHNLSSVPGAASGDAFDMEAGARIVADPGAHIAIASWEMTEIYGQIVAPGGSISLAVNYDAEALASGFTVGPAGPLYIGPQAVLDVAGTVLVNPVVTPIRTFGQTLTPFTGQVLAGGTVSLTDDVSPVLVSPGAVIDVSGAAGAFDVTQLQAGKTLDAEAETLVRQPVWSNAGTVSIEAWDGLLFEATLVGQPGAAQAQGGTLSIIGDDFGGNAAKIWLVQDTAATLKLAGSTFNFATYVPTATIAFTPIDASAVPLTNLVFGVDLLAGSGFSSVSLQAPYIGFAGNVSLALNGSFTGAAADFVASNAGNVAFTENDLTPPLPGGRLNPTTDNATLSITAPYIDIGGGGTTVGGFVFANNGSVTLRGDEIDVSGNATFSNIGQLTLISSGDIRLLPGTGKPNGTQLLGGMYIDGNITFEAADVYPATDTLFSIFANPASICQACTALPTTVTFAYAPGGSASLTTPYSAAGALVVDANAIVQDGEIQAPFGAIVLGSSGTSTFAGTAYTIPTQSVTLGEGSVTSVSANGMVIPFGSTVDQTTWVYNPTTNDPGIVPSSAVSAFSVPITAAPQGVVTLIGGSVAFNTGAVVNLSGGGTLQAQEWVPGTGGSRNLLLQYQTSYATSASGTQVPTYADARDVYAIVPGNQGPLAPFDANLTQSGLTAGQSIWLVGGNGLAAGYYTLLPAQYATLPGAFRVVVNSGAANPLTLSYQLPDGTMLMAGYLANALTGTRSSTVEQFYVQPAAVWGGYSQYALTSATTFFPAYAALNNLASPWVPLDAGRLAVEATSALTLNGTLLGAPAPGGYGAQVDISSQFIEVVGNGETVQPGYLAISASQLDNLGASSLLIGGLRSFVPAGMQITPTANGVIVATDAQNPLKAPEIILAATPLETQQTIALDDDGDSVTIPVPVAGTGQVALLPGSVVQASGTIAPGEATNLILGNTLATLPVLPSSSQVSNAFTLEAELTSYYTALTGSLGTLVRVSNGSPDTAQMVSQAVLTPVAITMTDDVNTANPAVTVTLPALAGFTSSVVGAGAQINGGNSLLLASTGDTQIQAGAVLSGSAIQATSSVITFLGSGSAPSAGSTIDPATLVQLQNAETVDLQSRTSIDFQGNVTLQMAGADGQASLALSAGSYSSNGGQVSIGAPTLVLDNELGAAAPSATGGSGSLAIDVGTLAFGSGSKSLAGFGSVSLLATQGVLGEGTGSMDFGALPVTLQTPVMIAGTGSTQTLTTTGALSVVPVAGTALVSATLGGAFTLQGGSVTVAAPIQAPSGDITLTAGTGDVTVTGSGALLAQGVAQDFIDVTEYVPAGAIALTATTGNVTIQPGAVIDFSGAAGGDAGSLTVAAPAGTVSLIGTLAGQAAASYRGGSFSLTTGGAVDLDTLASVLTAGGVTTQISVTSGAGNLLLSSGNTLTATTVTLVANGGTGSHSDTTDGNVVIDGTINANGVATPAGSAAGGTINLYGNSGVDLEGTLLAESSDAYLADGRTPNPRATQLGGTVTIGTGAVFSAANGYNATSGYENMTEAGAGAITLGANAVINVSGGTFDGVSGGTVLLRAPLLEDGSVPVTIQLTKAAAQVIGARAFTLEAYAVWSTSDTTTGAQHFDGIIDPAGWYSSTGTLLGTGSFVNTSGTVVSTWSGSALTNEDGTTNSLSYYLSNDYYLLPGQFTNASGTVVATWSGTTLTNDDGTATTLSDYLSHDTFTQTGGNASHESFYGYVNGNNLAAAPGTLMGFIENPGFKSVASTSGIANFQEAPGVELDNPVSAGVNDGSIQVLTSWNLGAVNGSQLVYRTLANGAAPFITLRAGGSVVIDAAITDGFTAIGALAVTPIVGGAFPSVSYNSADNFYSSDLPGFSLSGLSASAFSFVSYNTADNDYLTDSISESLAGFPTGGLSFDYSPILVQPAAAGAGGLGLPSNATTDGYYGAYEDYLTAYTYYANNDMFYNEGFFVAGGTTLPTNIGNELTAANNAYAAMGNNISLYNRSYLSAYNIYAQAYFAWTAPLGAIGALADAPLPPPAVSVPTTGAGSGLQTGGLSFTVSPAVVPPATAAAIGLAATSATATYYGAYEAYLNAYSAFFTTDLSPNNAFFSNSGTPASATVTADLATANAAYSLVTSTNYKAYVSYLADYATYAGDYSTWAGTVGAVGSLPEAPLPPPALVILPPVPPVAVNTPAAVASPVNLAPIAAMNLADEAASSSYRFVAGANFASADPLALAANTDANVTLDGHTMVPVSTTGSYGIAVPTIVRTGTGSIDIAASGDFELLDPLAPGVVYTAGTASTAPTVAPSIVLGEGDYQTGQFGREYGVSTILTQPAIATGAGDITITVGRNVIGTENVLDTLARGNDTSTVTPSGVSSQEDAFVGQFWDAWLLAAPNNANVGWYVNFGSFDQGVMSVGGNVTVHAGGDIRDFAVSLPTNGFLGNGKLTVNGGGNLAVSAGGNIYSGDFYVGQGSGAIASGGTIAPDFDYLQTYPVATLLAVQYGTIDVTTRTSANIGGVYDPTYLFTTGMFTTAYGLPVISQATVSAAQIDLMPYVTSMGTSSSVSVEAIGGDTNFNTLLVQEGLFSLGSAPVVGNESESPGLGVTSLLLPASLSLVSIAGNVNVDHGGGLYPSATGTLSLIAGQSVTLAVPLTNAIVNGQDYASPPLFPLVGNVFGFTLEKLDYPVGTGILPTAAAPGLVEVWNLQPTQSIDPSLLQDSVSNPVTIVALNGSLIDGVTEPTASFFTTAPGAAINQGGTMEQISLITNAPAAIYAGQDILDLPFYGENYASSDVTSIVAGQDIRYNIDGEKQASTIELAGPGTLIVQAGRNITFNSQLLDGGAETGIRTIGNATDPSAAPILGSGFIPASSSATSALALFGNPYLPKGGAAVDVLFGVGPGIDTAAFIAAYIDPATASAFALATIDWPQLDAQGNPDGTVLTPQQFWPIFETLSPTRQRLDVEQALFEVLNATGKDYNNPSSPYYHQYTNGYQAINTLFPASYGYTINDLTGGSNGANLLVDTGTLDLRGSTIQTQQGGGISIVGPGGRVLVGSAGAAPAANPSTQGILTLEGGGIDIFADQDVLVAQSRIMTEQGGDIVMWSSNGNLDAGEGAKTSVSVPPPLYSCDIDFVCSIDVKGVVSGAGIATLQSLPDVPIGDANLMAPRGTVNAGAAGIRVSGNLNIAALHVANTFNLQVQGTTTGIPTAAVPNVGSLTAASNAAGSAAAAAAQVGQSRNHPPEELPSIITVEVIGYGGGAPDDTEPQQEQQRRRRPGAQSYNLESPVQIVGHGMLTAAQLNALTPEEQASKARLEAPGDD